MRLGSRLVLIILATALVLMVVYRRPSTETAHRAELGAIGTSGAGEGQDAGADVILLAANATVAGAWRIVADATAAAGKAAVLPNTGRAKVMSPVANPADYFTLTFDAAAGTPYHIWVRGRADGNAAVNDSVHIEFSESVDASGNPIWDNWVAINLEDCSGCGNSGWGWEDNGWGSVGALGPHVQFARTGRKVLRVQNREDGFYIDQIVLSPSTYLTAPPGANKNDSTILGGGSTPSAPEIVMHAASAVVAGAWRLVADSGAASGTAAVLPNTGRAKLTTPLANPTDYFELTFNAVANTPYRLWVRGRADGNAAVNDSVHVQFTNSINASGAAAWRIGTTTGVAVNLEDCSGCGNAGWGWEDNGWGSATALGPEIRFATTGVQRIRVQNREDGFFIDQIVLSPSAYLRTAPGANKNDSTILESTEGTPPPPPPAITLVRLPYLQQMTDRSVIVVWASRESGVGTVRVNGRTITADTRLVPATTTGMTADYYQHEAVITGLAASTVYPYEVWVGGTRAATSSFKTAPAPGTGGVTFIAFGDSGIGSTAQKTLASRMAEDTWDIALHAGDIVYGYDTGGDATYKTYHAWLFDIYRDWFPRRPFFPSMGNHDGRQTNGYGKAYLDLFVLPREPEAGTYSDYERYYSFDYGPVHFVVLDTERAFYDTARRAVQLRWLANDLSSTSQPWKVALFHKPPYSSGIEHGSDLTVRSVFTPLFEEHGVQMAITGHDHNFERTVPWRPAADTSRQAVTYIVTGGGGSRLRSVGISSFTARSAMKYHYVRITISGCVLTGRAVGTDGVAFDNFTLDRCQQASDAGPPTVRITAPGSGATVSGLVTVTASAADDIRVEKVDLWVDGVLKVIDRTSPYSFSWDSRTVPAGSHVLEARAYDIAGNRVSSAKVTVTSTGS